MSVFTISQHFELVTDTVMGGISQGTLTREIVRGRHAYRLRGTVSLENNGGFIQMAAGLPFGSGPSVEPQDEDSSAFDASTLTGIELGTIGNTSLDSLGLRPNRETYNIHLRTSDLTRPWQSYRQSFIAGPEWETHRIPFTDFAPHRTEIPLDLSKLRRIGILAIGRVFEADVSVSRLRLYQ